VEAAATYLIETYRRELTVGSLRVEASACAALSKETYVCEKETFQRGVLAVHVWWRQPVQHIASSSNGLFYRSLSGVTFMGHLYIYMYVYIHRSLLTCVSHLWMER